MTVRDFLHFFLRGEPPAYHVCLNYFFSGMNFQPMAIQPDLLTVSEIFFQG